MTLSEYFALERGNQAGLAVALGLSTPGIRQWVVGIRPIPVEHGAAIERATGGQVTRQELFPDIWARIWPELVAPAAEHPGKFSGVSTIDHAAELRGAIAQTRLVFEGHRVAQDALEYLEQVLKAGQRAEVPTHACAPEARAAAAMAAESAQLVIQAEKAAAGAAARATVEPVAVLSRELFSLADKLQQPADLVVQLLVLAELRGMRAEQASDRYACGAAVLS